MRSGPVHSLAAFAAVVALTVATGTAALALSGPFVDQDGRWRGSGTILLSSGTREPIGCRAQNIVTDDGNTLQQALRCASDSYKFEVNSYVDHDSGSITGHWDDLTNNVSGDLDGSLTGRRIDATISATGFTAGFRMDMAPTRQSVLITPEVEDADISEVSIDLRKQ